MSTLLPEAARDIRNRAAAYSERRFLLRNLVHTTLPHRKLDAETWRREAGKFSLEMTRRRSKPTERYCSVTIPNARPYGPKARLLLIYACTWALAEKGRFLPLGDNLTEFLELVGLGLSRTRSGGGLRGDGALLKDQLRRFWYTTIVFEEIGAGLHALQVQLSTEIHCDWLRPETPEFEALNGSYMLLTEDFVRHVTTPGVCIPLDARAVAALSHSSLALDLYALLSNRSFVAQKKSEDQLLRWSQLGEQLGQGYSELREFRRSALDLLPLVADVYPGLSYRLQRGGRSRASGLIVLADSRPAIAAADAEQAK